MCLHFDSLWWIRSNVRSPRWECHFKDAEKVTNERCCAKDWAMQNAHSSPHSSANEMQSLSGVLCDILLLETRESINFARNDNVLILLNLKTIRNEYSIFVSCFRTVSQYIHVHVYVAWYTQYNWSQISVRRFYTVSSNSWRTKLYSNYVNSNHLFPQSEAVRTL